MTNDLILFGLEVTAVAGAIFALMAYVLFPAGSRAAIGFGKADYRAKPLLTPWELNTLKGLVSELPPGFHACPQVRLADLVVITAGDFGQRRAALNRVASKSVDFVVTDALGRAALVIELDDKTHNRPDRQDRDQLVDAVLRQCGLPLLRVRPGQKVDARAALAGVYQQAAASLTSSGPSPRRAALKGGVADRGP